MALTMRPTIFMGLGGTGLRVALAFKKILLDQFGEVPPLVRIMVFDTADEREETELTTNSGDRVELLTDQEFIHLKYMPREVLDNLSAYPHVSAWFPEKELQVLADAVTAVADGAPNRLRKSGRLGLFIHADKVVQLVTQAKASVQSPDSYSRTQQLGVEVQEGAVNALIAASICGGTGSGTLLDFAYLMQREILQQDNEQRCNGYLVLPGAFPNVHPKETLYGNAYATLKELDHYSTERKYETALRNTGPPIRVEGRPFHFCYLMDGRDQRQQLQLQSASELAEIVASGVAVQTFDARVTGNQGLVASGALDAINDKLVLGHLPHFSTFGRSRIYLPTTKLRGYMIGRLGGAMMDAVLDPGGFQDATLNPVERQDRVEARGAAVTEAVAEFLRQNVDQTALEERLQPQGRQYTLQEAQLRGLPREQLSSVIAARSQRLRDELLPELREGVIAAGAAVAQELLAACEVRYYQIVNDLEQGPEFAKLFLEELKAEIEKLRSALSESITTATERGPRDLRILALHQQNAQRASQSWWRKRLRLWKPIRLWMQAHSQLGRSASHLTVLQQIDQALLTSLTDDHKGIDRLALENRDIQRKVEGIRGDLGRLEESNRVSSQPGGQDFNRSIFDVSHFEKLYDNHTFGDPGVIRGHTRTMFESKAVPAVDHWTVPEEAKAIMPGIETFVGGLIRRDLEMTIDEAIDRLNNQWGEPFDEQQQLETLRARAVTWLPLDDVALQTHGLPLEKEVLGVAEHDKGSLAQAAADLGIEGVVSTGEKQEAQIYKARHAITPMAISALADYEEGYHAILTGDTRNPLHTTPEAEFWGSPRRPQNSPEHIRSYMRMEAIGCISARAGSLGTEVYIDILGAPEVMVEGSHDQLRYRAWRAFHKNAAWQEAAIPAWIDFNNEPDPTTGAARDVHQALRDFLATLVDSAPMYEPKAFREALSTAAQAELDQLPPSAGGNPRS